LTNPPVGTRGANQGPDRDDFTVATSNKQLNFLQHILTVLKPGGRAAVVVPDNCLFADQAGEVFRLITEDCDLHTVLRLPNGTFTPYSPGTKTNVVFFTKGTSTETTWIYDGRTNVPQITKRERPLKAAHFAEFERCFGSDPNGRSCRVSSESSEDRWRAFSIGEIRQHGLKIDALRWLREESSFDSVEAPPEQLVTEAATELRAALEALNEVLGALEEAETAAEGA
jgi:type I restriction enzyme M protein